MSDTLGSRRQWVDGGRCGRDAQFFLQSDEPGVSGIHLHRVAALLRQPEHRFVVVERIGEHAPDTRCGRLTLEPREQGTADSLALPIVGDRNGELAAGRIALFNDVSRLADHDLAAVLENLGQQSEMAAIVDTVELSRHRFWQLIECAHEAVMASAESEWKNSRCSSKSWGKLGRMVTRPPLATVTTSMRCT